MYKVFNVNIINLKNIFGYDELLPNLLKVVDDVVGDSNYWLIISY